MFSKNAKKFQNIWLLLQENFLPKPYSIIAQSGHTVPLPISFVYRLLLESRDEKSDSNLTQFLLRTAFTPYLEVYLGRACVICVIYAKTKTGKILHRKLESYQEKIRMMLGMGEELISKENIIDKLTDLTIL